MSKQTKNFSVEITWGVHPIDYEGRKDHFDPVIPQNHRVKHKRLVHDDRDSW
jgi:hypothetical protein